MTTSAPDSAAQLNAERIREIRDALGDDTLRGTIRTSDPTLRALCDLALEALELRAKLERAHEGLKQYQAAVASCLSVGGVVLNADGIPNAWWESMITAQQNGAQAIKEDK